MWEVPKWPSCRPRLDHRRYRSGANKIQRGNTPTNRRNNIQGSHNNYSSTVTGNNNQTKLSVGDTTNATNLRNAITETITGNSNLIIQNLIGNYITSGINITGSSNQITQQLLSSSGTKIIDTVLRKAMDDNDKDQVACLKMCLDRMLPTSLFEKDAKGQRNAIQINITGIGEAKVEQASEIIEDYYEDVDYTEGTDS